MFETELRYLMYKIENPQRLAAAGQDYAVNRALRSLPKKTVVGGILFWLGSGLIALGQMLERLSGQSAQPDAKSAPTPRLQQQRL